MAEVTVQEQTAGVFAVTVDDGATSSSHTVRVPAGLPRTLGLDAVAAAELVGASFTFLLEREPATAILRDFTLDQIGHYFPDYPEEIRRRLG